MVSTEQYKGGKYVLDDCMTAHKSFQSSTVCRGVKGDSVCPNVYYLFIALQDWIVFAAIKLVFIGYLLRKYFPEFDWRGLCAIYGL